MTHFFVGIYGAFDSLAAAAVSQAKFNYPGIKLILLCPYTSTANKVENIADFDSLFYPPGMEKAAPKYAIVKANRYIVDHVDYLIAYACGSNAKKLVEYARRSPSLLGISILYAPQTQKNTAKPRLGSI